MEPRKVIGRACDEKMPLQKNKEPDFGVFATMAGFGVEFDENLRRILLGIRSGFGIWVSGG